MMLRMNLCTTQRLFEEKTFFKTYYELNMEWLDFLRMKLYPQVHRFIWVFA
jgi:hypothetical protein